MDRKGHFYEQRFGSREILDDAANLCCNIYVDLNQIKAGMACSLEESSCSAIQDRLQTWRNDEAQASVEAFHTNSPDRSFSLEAGDVDRLLADCFLAPIGDQGPPLLANVPSRRGLPESLAVATAPESPVPFPTESTVSVTSAAGKAAFTEAYQVADKQDRYAKLDVIRSGIVTALTAETATPCYNKDAVNGPVRRVPLQAALRDLLVIEMPPFSDPGNLPVALISSL